MTLSGFKEVRDDPGFEDQYAPAGMAGSRDLWNCQALCLPMLDSREGVL